MDLTGENLDVGKAVFLLETTGKSASLSSPASRSCGHSLAHGPCLAWHLPVSLSDHPFPSSANKDPCDHVEVHVDNGGPSPRP